MQEVTFYPWGRIWNQTSGYSVHQEFASLSAYDPDMDQYQTPNRMYPPILGRWLTPDPAGMAAANPANPQSWNRYAYVLNNPANLTDPTGLFEGCTNTPDPEACVQGFNPPPSSCIDPNDLFCNEGNPDPFFLPDGGGGGGGGSSGGGGGTVGGGGGTPTILAATASTGEGVIDLSGTLLKVISRACGWNPVCIDILLGGASVDPEVAAGIVIAGVAIYKGVQAGVQIYQAAKTKVPTIEELQRNCTPGRRVVEPARNYPGGLSVEQEYICDGVPYTVHCLYTKTGINKGCHVRPGSPKGAGGGL